MIRFNTPDNHFWRNVIKQSAFIAIMVMITVWFLPRNEAQLLKYDVGKPWMYSSFIAKFDFPIYKTESALQEEKDSLKKSFEPYFYYNSNVENEQISRFKKKFEKGMPDIPASDIKVIVAHLHEFYKKGIVSAPDYSRVFTDSTSRIRIIREKTARSTISSGVLSTMAAYERLFVDKELAQHRPALQRCNLNEFIVPNIIYDKNLSESELNDILSSLPIASGMVMSGQKIIGKGEIVDEHVYRILNSFEKEMERRNTSSNEMKNVLYGQIMFVAIILILFTIYLGSFRREYFGKTNTALMLYAQILIFPILVYLMVKYNFLSVYMLPFAMTPILTRVFMDSRTAFVVHTTMVLLCSAALKYQYDFIIIQLVAGMVAIYSVNELSKRAQIFSTAIYVTVSSSLVYIALQLMQNNSIDWGMFAMFAISGVFILFTYPLMYLIEKTFGFTSNVTLIELSNTNNEILRRLSEIAPGTFQHSVTVGNLAAAIADKIGAKALLVRTGAMYHDIGKMSNPVFFTENQAGVNPHEKISDLESAQIIISHVTEGVKMAEQINLPSVIKSFITTHHGSGMAKYFYINYKNAHPDEEVDESKFTYPGPDPFTKEQAILAMADTVEAASRSLPDYTEESISNLVNRLIDTQLKDGRFKNCPITFLDIENAKMVLIEKLKSIYHTRISYPELKK